MDTNVRQCLVCDIDIDVIDYDGHQVCDDCFKKIEESGLAVDKVNSEGELEFIGTKQQFDKLNKSLEGEQTDDN